jgi:hypothetical protein
MFYFELILGKLGSLCQDVLEFVLQFLMDSMILFSCMYIMSQ